MATALLQKSCWGGEVAGAAWGPSLGTFLVESKAATALGRGALVPIKLRASASKKGV